MISVISRGINHFLYQIALLLNIFVGRKKAPPATCCESQDGVLKYIMYVKKGKPIKIGLIFLFSFGSTSAKATLIFKCLR